MNYVSALFLKIELDLGKNVFYRGFQLGKNVQFSL